MCWLLLRHNPPVPGRNNLKQPRTFERIEENILYYIVVYYMICATLCHQNPEPSKVATILSTQKHKTARIITWIHSPFHWRVRSLILRVQPKSIGCIFGVCTMPLVYFYIFYGYHSFANVPSSHGSAHGTWVVD